METLGDGAEGLYEREWEAFSSRPQASVLLIEAYRGSLPGDRVLRMMLASGAGRLLSDDIASFLLEVATEPAVADGVDAEAEARALAGVSLARMVAAGAPAAPEAVMRALRDATPAVAQQLALELFVHDVLTDDHRATLQERGVAASFRKLSEQETHELFAIPQAESEAARPSTNREPDPPVPPQE